MKMRILQLCPLWFPISRNAPGGIETFMAHLAAELIRRGCEVTLVATGDSDAPGDLLPVVPRNLVDQMRVGDALEYVYYEQQQIQIALKHAKDFDIVHSFVGPGAYILSGVEGVGHRVLHTVQTPVYPDFQWFAQQNPDMWLSTVSELQADKLRQQGARRCYMIPNGLDSAAFELNTKAEKSCLFLGRIEHEKGPDIAIRVAQRLGLRLILAGPIVQHDFFKSCIEPFLSNQVRYIGVADHAAKTELIGQAACVLMPSRWDEPFGMVAIEAMACGTPVVALANGALPDIIEPGLTGYFSKDEESLASLVDQAMQLDRARIRDRVVQRFDISVIAKQYCRLYEQIAFSGAN
jgi:glycosyltransferase involved in cell wall biosynthesis